MIAKAGRLIQITEGCYSDYQVICFCVVLKDFNPEEEIILYKELYPNGDNEYNTCYTTDKFLAYLFSKGYLLELDRDVLHLGDYYALNSDFYFAPFTSQQ